MDQNLDANPLLKHADVWPRKARRLVEAIASALKLSFLVSSQRAHSSPSATERALADLSAANETIRMQQRIIDLLSARMSRIKPSERPRYLPEERLSILLLMQWNPWSTKEAAKIFLVSHGAICRWLRVWRGRTDPGLFFGKPPWNRLSDGVRDLVHHLRELCPEPEVGYRTLANWLKKAGIAISRSSVQRFLREKPRKRPSAAPTKASEASTDTVPFNILRPAKPNRTWHLDLTTIRVLWLTFHVAMLLDGYSRKVLALRVFRSEPKSREIARLVRRAYKDHGQPRFLVTDHGSQFRSAFRKAIETDRTELVKGKVRSCTFNGKVERFAKSLKLWQRVTLMFAGLLNVQKKLDVYRTWFNHERIHQGINGLTPEEVWSGTKRPAPKAYLASDNYQPAFDVERIDYERDAHLPVIRIRAIQEVRRVA